MEKTFEKKGNRNSLFGEGRDEVSIREDRDSQNSYSESSSASTNKRRSFNPNFDKDNHVYNDMTRSPFGDSNDQSKRKRPRIRKEGAAAELVVPMQYRENQQERASFAERNTQSNNIDEFFESRNNSSDRFSRGDRGASQPYRNDRNSGSSRYNRDQRESTPFSRGDRESTPFNRGDRDSSRFNRNDRESNRFNRNDRDSDRFNRSDRDSDRFNRSDRGERRAGGSRFSTKGDKQYAEKRSFDSSSRPKKKKDEPFSLEPCLEGAVRLNRFIAMSGLCSRRDADQLILEGAITVNGVVVTELGTKVTNDDVVCKEGMQLRGEKLVYIVMNKPKGVVTTVDDPNAEKTVIDLLQGKVKERVFPVGRLDKNSLGLILLTNDGELTKELTHPSFEKKKIYHVFLDKAVVEADIEKLAEGVELEDGLIYADELSYVEDNPREVGIEIHSGRNRIVRRMFEHIGYKVIKLDRVYFAGITKKGLKRGFWRYLTAQEVIRLKNKRYK